MESKWTVSKPTKLKYKVLKLDTGKNTVLLNMNSVWKFSIYSINVLNIKQKWNLKKIHKRKQNIVGKNRKQTFQRKIFIINGNKVSESEKYTER